MKKTELTKLRSKEIVELEKKLVELKNQAKKGFVQRKAGKSKELKEVKNLRHSIAQIMTIITEKKMISEKSNEKEKETK